jgi:hypothetical protein
MIAMPWMMDAPRKKLSIKNILKIVDDLIVPENGQAILGISAMER